MIPGLELRRGLLAVTVSDAVASSVPECHRVVLESILPRFDEQAIIATTAEAPAAWRPERGGT